MDMNEIMLQISARIRAIRKDNKLTQREFAELFGISQSSYSAYESGSTMPTLEFLIKVATKYNLSMDYIAGLSQSKKGLQADEDNQFINENLFQPLLNNGNDKKAALTEIAKSLEAQMLQINLAIKNIYNEIAKINPDQQ